MSSLSESSFEELRQKASKIHSVLMEQKQTLALAESLTGGLLSYVLTIKPEASRFFLGSIVSYSYFSKTKFLNLPTELLTRKGAVNESACQLMTQSVKKNWKSDWALAVTGVAGPGKMEHDPDIGVVFMGVSGPDYAKVERFLLKKEAEEKNRQDIRQKSAIFALDFLQSCIRMGKQ